MDPPPTAAGSPSERRQRALRGVAALCQAVDRPASASHILQRALPVLRDVLGDRVAFDMREPTGSTEPATAGGVVAPLVGHGQRFGSLRANGFELDVRSAEAFASAAGRIVGAALAHQAEIPARARTDAAHVTPALAHRLRSAVATIGVAASTLQTRGHELSPEVLDQLLVDIEANVAALKGAIDELTASDAGPGHDG